MNIDEVVTKVRVSTLDCHHFQKLLIAYFAGELSEKQVEKLEGHLAKCSVCRRVCDEEKQLQEMLRKTIWLQSHIEFLQECRTELRTLLRYEKRKRNRREIVKIWLKTLFQSRYRWVAKGAVISAIFVFGILLGIRFWLLPSRLQTFSVPETEVSTTVLKPGVKILAMRFLNFNPEKDYYRVQVDRLESTTIEGGIANPWIQQLLAYALKQSPRDGLRLRALKALQSYKSVGQVDSTVINALILAAERDANPGVRLKAVKALRSYLSQSLVQRALIRILLRDSNPAIRMEALAILSQIANDDMYFIIYGIAREDSNQYIRFLANKMIENRSKVEIR